MTTAEIRAFCANCRWHTTGMRYAGKPRVHWCNDYMRDCRDITCHVLAPKIRGMSKKEGRSVICSECGEPLDDVSRPDICPACKVTLDWSEWREPYNRRRRIEEAGREKSQ
jgi:hypothetical protein